MSGHLEQVPLHSTLVYKISYKRKMSWVAIQLHVHTDLLQIIHHIMAVSEGWLCIYSETCEQRPLIKYTSLFDSQIYTSIWIIKMTSLQRPLFGSIKGGLYSQVFLYINYAVNFQHTYFCFVSVHHSYRADRMTNCVMLRLNTVNT